MFGADAGAACRPVLVGFASAHQYLAAGFQSRFSQGLRWSMKMVP
jgi:hypothetical protein